MSDIFIKVACYGHTLPALTVTHSSIVRYVITLCLSTTSVYVLQYLLLRSRFLHTTWSPQLLRILFDDRYANRTVTIKLCIWLEINLERTLDLC